MGEIKTILFAGKVDRPENNRLFRIVRAGGHVVIQYRNINVRLTEKDFETCIAELVRFHGPKLKNFNAPRMPTPRFCVI